MKEKLKSKSFWVTVFSAVMLLVSCFGIKFETAYVNEMINVACALLILLGVITVPGEGTEGIEHIISEEKKDDEKDKEK